MKLRPYQERILEDLKYIPSIGLFMGTGTGKTITSIFRSMDNNTSHLLVICPSKVVQQWEAVLADFSDYYTVISLGEYKTVKAKNQALTQIMLRLLSDRDIPHAAIVVSLESVWEMRNVRTLVTLDWTVIVDESHKIKEFGTKKNPIKRTEAVLAIGEQTDSKIILTATPTQKDKGGYIDYFTQLKFLGYFPQWTLQDFHTRYCVMEKLQTPGMPYPIQVIKRYKNTEEIDKILLTVCRRYVARLGEFEPQHTIIPISKAPAYRRLATEKWYKDLDLTNLSQRRIAKKTLCTGVVMGTSLYKERLTYEDNKNKVDWLNEFLSNTDETVVIFYKYNVELATLEALCKHLGKKYIVINGATKNKYAEINKKNYDVVLGQFGAAGESLDGLQHRSHICVYFALPESSLEHRQALGRIDRDGQTLVPMYYYLVMQGTIEEDIWDMTQRKIEFSEETLNKLEVVE